MHPRNKYSENPADFGELAEFRPSLRPYLIEKHPVKSFESASKFSYTVDFSNPLAVRELTCAVLERDFGLKVLIPSGVLVPVVPQKLNYIHWIEDLISPVGETASGHSKVPRGKEIFGIDIGTGTTCIYPLLGCKLNAWSFVATDVSKEAVESAKTNVNINNLEDSIEGTVLEELLESRTRDYSFTMCNPPFFKSRGDKLGQGSSRTACRPVPSTCSSGTDNETITEGGELEFAKSIIRDSLKYKHRVKWYTSMLGKKATMKEVIKELKSNEVPVVTSTEFVQGKTWRWGVAWSYDTSLKTKEDELKVNSRKRRQAVSGDVLQLLFRGEEKSVPTSDLGGLQMARQWLENQLNELKIEWELVTSQCSSSHGDVCQTWSSRMIQYQCHAHKATWAHQRKKRRLQHKLSQLNSESAASASFTPAETNTEAAPYEDLQKKLQEEMDGLSPPCDLNFSCAVCIIAADEASRHIKKKKTSLQHSEIGTQEGEAIAMELQWLGGDGEKDMLHQIVQFLSNKMDTTDFSLNTAIDKQT